MHKKFLESIHQKCTTQYKIIHLIYLSKIKTSRGFHGEDFGFDSDCPFKVVLS